MIEGLNACPLDRGETMKWTKEGFDVKWIRPLKRPQWKEAQMSGVVESLQDAAIRAAVGLDCWRILLPERHRRALAECAVTHGLCEQCLRPVRKVTLDCESDGMGIQASFSVIGGQI